MPFDQAVEELEELADDAKLRPGMADAAADEAGGAAAGTAAGAPPAPLPPTGRCPGLLGSRVRPLSLPLALRVAQSPRSA